MPRLLYGALAFFLVVGSANSALAADAIVFDSQQSPEAQGWQAHAAGDAPAPDGQQPLTVATEVGKPGPSYSIRPSDEFAQQTVAEGLTVELTAQVATGSQADALRVMLDPISLTFRLVADGYRQKLLYWDPSQNQQVAALALPGVEMPTWTIHYHPPQEGATAQSPGRVTAYVDGVEAFIAPANAPTSQRQISFGATLPTSTRDAGTVHYKQVRLTPGVPGDPPAPPELDLSDPAVQQRLVAESLFALIEFTPPEGTDHNLSRRPRLQAIHRLSMQGQYGKALDAFRNYFLFKLANPTTYGLSPALVDGYAKHRYFNPPVNRSADMAKRAANILERGFQPDNIDGTFARYNGLLNGYIITGDRAYLELWSKSVDHWAQHSTWLADINAVEVSDGDQIVMSQIVNLFKLLNGVAVAMPESHRDAIDSVAFARLMTRLAPLPAVYIAYHRVDPQNWRSHVGESLAQLAFLVDEFKTAPALLREARRMQEEHTSLQNLPDGTETQQDPWYNFMYYHVAAMLEVLDARRSSLPGWQLHRWERPLHDPEWELAIREEMQRRARFLARHIQLNNQYPIGARRDQRANSTSSFFGNDGIMTGVRNNVPEVLVEPNIRRLLDTVRRPGPRTDVPTFTSDSFPYGGYYYIREGWQPGDSYGFFFCSPAPGAYGGRRSMHNNNTLGLHAFGRDLVLTGEQGPYDNVPSPLTVDGLQQNFHSGLPWGIEGLQNHKVSIVTAWDEPNDTRWHHSDAFDLVEGVYDGPYGHHSINLQQRAKLNKEALRGAEHRRQVIYLRRLGLWLIDDRVDGPGEHTFEQHWYLPLKSPGKGAAFLGNEIKTSDIARTITTAKPAAPNVTFYHVGQPHLRYDRKPQLNNGHGFMRIGASWTSSDASRLMTLIQPRAAGDEQVLDVQPLVQDGEEIGLSTTTADGQRVEYASSSSGAATLTLGDVTATAESLVLVTSPEGETRGLALGVESMTIADAPQAVTRRDFEFVIRENKLAEQTPIYRPIKPVEILPDLSAFVGQQQVTLQSQTPDVVIRYTLDGTEPTLHSPVYREPFTIDRTTTIRALAFRPETTQVPDVMSSTHMTPVSEATLVREGLNEPVNAPGDSAGLRYSYYENDWPSLMLLPALGKPVDRGVGPLFDISSRQRDVNFAYVYEGYMEVPEDGLYTLHAPREMVQVDTDAGYELIVELGQRGPLLEQWYPATSRHGFGKWSVGLQKGHHPIRVYFADFRGDAVKRRNHPDMERNLVWDGQTPDLRISRPGMETPRPIPAEWLSH